MRRLYEQWYVNHINWIMDELVPAFLLVALSTVIVLVVALTWAIVSGGVTC